MDNNEKKVRQRTNIDERKAIRRACKIPADFSVKNHAGVGRKPENVCLHRKVRPDKGFDDFPAIVEQGARPVQPLRPR